MGSYKSILNQSIRLPPPLLTEHTLPDQTNKIVIITGGYAGLGQELTRILYQKNATIYILGRSSQKASVSIAATKALFPDSTGRLEFIAIDLADLSTIKGAANEFLRREGRLDVLVNNAGVVSSPSLPKFEAGLIGFATRCSLQQEVCLLKTTSFKLLCTHWDTTSSPPSFSHVSPQPQKLVFFGQAPW